MPSMSPPPAFTFTTTRDPQSRSSSRSSSQQSSSSSDKHTTSLPWILHHILERQLSSELPLRIMFSFNAGEQLPSLKQAHEWWHYTTKGKLIIEFLSNLPRFSPSNHELATDQVQLDQIRKSNWGQIDDFDSERCSIDRFMDLNHDLLFDIDLTNDGDLPRTRNGLPPKLVRNMCLKICFKKSYQDAQFNRALSALDYLRDLECTRRTALRDAATRLRITKEDWREVLSGDHEAYLWVESIQKQELVIETYYANVYIDFRIWTMVHELQSEPFYKPNALAMLNTLFPPNTKDVPNDQIDVKALERCRATFYKHILTVEARGTGVVKDFVRQLLMPKAKHGWGSARQSLKKYLELAEIMIEEASAVISDGSARDSLQHSRTSGENSSFSERFSIASSANTSVDSQIQSISGARSPGISLPKSTPNFKSPGRVRGNKSADAAITLQPHLSSLSFPPQHLGSDGSHLQDKSPYNVRNRRDHATFPSSYNSPIGPPPSGSVPPLPLNEKARPPLPDFTPPNPDAKPASQENSDGSRNKSHSIPAPKPLTHPRVGVNGQRQVTPKSPLSSAFSPEKFGKNFTAERSKPRTYTDTSNELQSDGLDFLNHPYSRPASPELRPRLKKKTSITNMFRRKESDATTLKKSPSTASLRTLKGPESTESFPQYSETEAGKSKKKSKRSVKGVLSNRSSVDMSFTSTSANESRSDMVGSNSAIMKSTTWTNERKSDKVGSQSAVVKSTTWTEETGSEIDIKKPRLKKNRSATALLGSVGKKAREALKIGKASPKRLEFFEEEPIVPYKVAFAEPAPHPPSAPSSPTAAIFASELNLPPRDTLRRIKSHEERPSKSKKITKSNSKRSVQLEPMPKYTTTGFHYPDNLKYPHGFLSTAPKPQLYDHRGLPIPRAVTATSLAEPLPTPYITRDFNLPLDSTYDLTRHREYIRTGLIEKARAERCNEEFEKPRPAPLPQVARRTEEFDKEVLWVPFEKPRATPKPPEVRQRELDRKEMPPPPPTTKRPKFVALNVSRFSN